MQNKSNQKTIMIMGLFLILAAVFLGGCKKNVGTPEDNATAAETTKPDEKEAVLFGISVPDTKIAYYDALITAMKEELVDNQGYQVVSKNSQGDAAVQEKQIQEMVDQGIKVLFLAPVDWEKISVSLDVLKDAGVRIVNIDTAVRNIDSVDAYVGTDNQSAGSMCGNTICSKFLDGGKIAILQNNTSNSINERLKAMEMTIATQPFEIVAREEAQLDGSDAKRITKNLLKKYPDTTLIICGNDSMTEGAIQALRDANNQAVTLIGFDGSPAVKKELGSEDSRVSADIGQSPLTIGKDAATVGIAIATGGDYEKETLVDPFTITKSNLSLYGTDGWQ